MVLFVFSIPGHRAAKLFRSVPQTTISCAGLCSTTCLPALPTPVCTTGAFLPLVEAAWNRLLPSHLCLRSSPSLFTLNAGVLAHRAPSSCSVVESTGAAARPSPTAHRACSHDGLAGCCSLACLCGTRQGDSHTHIQLSIKFPQNEEATER